MHYYQSWWEHLTLNSASYKMLQYWPPNSREIWRMAWRCACSEGWLPLFWKMLAEPCEGWRLHSRPLANYSCRATNWTWPSFSPNITLTTQCHFVFWAEPRSRPRCSWSLHCPSQGSRFCPWECMCSHADLLRFCDSPRFAELQTLPCAMVRNGIIRNYKEARRGTANTVQ